MNLTNLSAMALLCLCMTSNLIAQNITSSIDGVVLDNETNSPLSFATVKIVSQEEIVGTVADIDGYFILEGLKVGRYTLEASYVGYKSATISEILVRSGRASTVNFKLSQEGFMIEGIVVMPEKDKVKSLNKLATVSARQINVEEANRYAGGYDDPARLATSFAGVSSSEVGSNTIVIRGNSPKGLLWRIEGVKVPNPNHFGDVSGFGGGGISALSSQVMGTSDFITGAFPAEYGNGVAGVFDLSMRTGSNNAYNHTAQLSLLGMDISSEGPFSKKSKASYLFNYRYSTFGLLDKVLPKDNLLGISYQDLSFSINLPTSSAGVFGLWGLGFIDNQDRTLDLADRNEWEFNEEFEESNYKAYTGVIGLKHRIILGANSALKTSISVSALDVDYKLDRIDALDSLKKELYPTSKIKDRTVDMVFSTTFNHRFSNRHSMKMGIIQTMLDYKLNFGNAPAFKDDIITIVDEEGKSNLSQVFAQSSHKINRNLTINPGLNIMYFALTGERSIEPRMSLNLQLSNNQNIALGYGLHSQIEKLNFYFAKDPISGKQLNKNMKFTKSHHIVLSYEKQIGDYCRIKLEPYYQYLFDVPSEANSSYSFINLHSDFFVNRTLNNDGVGENYGLDLTFERFFHNGLYFLVTGSIFNSRYKAGDDVWRSTRYNKNLVGNFLIGKEWTIKKNNTLGVNAKYSATGGDRFTPALVDQSIENKKLVEDEKNAFSNQADFRHLFNFSISYRINKSKFSSVWSISLLNAFGSPDNYGLGYNVKTKLIDKKENTVTIPNISYKIEF